MDTKEIREKAARYLEQHGWQQGNSGGHGGPACMMSAVEEVMEPIQAFNHYDEILDELYEELGRSPIVWNDHPGRTVEEVLAALRGTRA